MFAYTTEKIEITGSGKGADLTLASAPAASTT